ncbi:hypothetical protein [Absidia glauca]|uniref:Major facilitator superfamily (MFS) profile domain-containing protein n=1 Tax=Absidia glauca TaxID=4829 RepID=A0A168RMW2_ABSGL|nr:hypothetical protein [Absidia glauca]
MNREEIEEGSPSHAAESIDKTEITSESENLKCLGIDVTHPPPSKEHEGKEVAVHCLKKSKKSATLLALLLVHFLCLMDLTIVSTTLTVIGADFNAFASISWVINAYILTYDVFRISTILTAAILLILALNFGGMTNTWNSVSVVVPLVLSIVLIAVFGVIEWKFAVDPILSPHLIRNRSLMMVCISNATFGANLFTVLYYLPLYLQVVKGDSTELSSIHLMPMRIATVVTSVSTGPLTGKTMCYRPYLWTGMIIIILHVGLISLFGVDTSYAEIFGITFFGGCGLGIVFPATAIAIISSIEPKHISVANGFGHFCRLLGASFGIAIANSVLNTGLQNRLPSILPPEYIEPVISSSLFVRDGLPDQYKAATLQVYADVLRMIWYTMIPLTSIGKRTYLLYRKIQSPVSDIYFVGFISSLFVKHYDLKNPGKLIAKANPINVNSEVIEIPQVEQVDNSMDTSGVGSNPTRQGDKSSRDRHTDSAATIKTSA